MPPSLTASEDPNVGRKELAPTGCPLTLYVHIGTQALRTHAHIVKIIYKKVNFKWIKGQNIGNKTKVLEEKPKINIFTALILAVLS